jgi:hypothetical protein
VERSATRRKSRQPGGGFRFAAPALRIQGAELRHASKMEQVEAALAAVGLRLIVDVAKTA